MVIAQDVFRDEEYAKPKAVLESAGVCVTTASRAAGPATGKLGMSATADVGIANVDPTEYDAVVFVGGAGAATFFDDPVAHHIARSAVERNVVLAAICIAPSTLAHAGLLEGRTATAFESQADDLVAHEADYTGEPVEVDGKIVTANGPAAATAFGTAITTLLGVA
jgi:protease I